VQCVCSTTASLTTKHQGQDPIGQLERPLIRAAQVPAGSTADHEDGEAQYVRSVEAPRAGGASVQAQAQVRHGELEQEQALGRVQEREQET